MEHYLCQLDICSISKPVKFIKVVVFRNMSSDRGTCY